MAIGPALASLDRQDLELFRELESTIDADLTVECNKHVPLLVVTVPLYEGFRRDKNGFLSVLAARLRAALVESYTNLGWSRVSFDDDTKIIRFHRESIIP